MYQNCILIAWKCVNEWWKYHQSISEPKYTLFGTQLLKLAEIAKFCKKLYENLYQLYECVWMSQKECVKVFKTNFTAHVYTFIYQKFWNWDING